MSRLAFIAPALLITLAACAAPPHAENYGNGTVSPAQPGYQTAVHGTVGAGITSNGPKAKANITLSICNNTSPVTVGVVGSDGRNSLEAQC